MYHKNASQYDFEAEHVFLDENERADGHSFYELADWSPSMDDQFLAISEDFIGRRKYQIRFRNNQIGEFLTDLIEDTDGSIVWANDHQTVFYIKKDPETLREYQVFRHRLGTDSADDQMVFQENVQSLEELKMKAINQGWLN